MGGSMCSPLDHIFNTQPSLIRIAEILGIANQATDTHEEFAHKCILSTFNLTPDQCKHIFYNQRQLFWNRAQTPWAAAIPLNEQHPEVYEVRKIWDNNIPRLNELFNQALHVIRFKEKFGDDDPIKAIFEDLNDRFLHGNQSIQNDLKPALGVIKEHNFFITAGVCLLAWTLQEDEKFYAQKVAAAFAGRAIPQKGVKFAMGLIALVGGAPVQLPSTQLQNVKLLLDGSAEELNTGINSRLSEIKTVLRELGLADIPPMRHNAVPRFKPGAKELLIRKIYQI